MFKPDLIHIEDQQVSCYIGVPDDERAIPQELLISTVFSSFKTENTKEDDIEGTVDYFSVSQKIDSVAQERPRKLIETLAEDIAQMVLTDFAVDEVSVMIKKFILPNTKYVGVSITRFRK